MLSQTIVSFYFLNLNNIILRAKISENELVINQYKNTFNTMKDKHSEEINNFNNHIKIINNYISLIYQFFNDITNNYFPNLNFSSMKIKMIFH